MKGIKMKKWRVLISVIGILIAMAIYCNGAPLDPEVAPVVGEVLAAAPLPTIAASLPITITMPINDDIEAPTSEVSAAEISAQLGYTDCATMIGTVNAEIVFIESVNGTEDWTEIRKSDMVTEVIDALDWWAAREPGVVTFTVEITTGLTYSEPIELDGLMERHWLPPVFGGTPFEWGYELRDFIRQRNYDRATARGADWGIMIVIVDSENDDDGRFADNSWAWGGRYSMKAVITSDCYVYGSAGAHKVLAHELGHLFCANDQYGCTHACTDLSGILQIPTQNADCTPACWLDEESIMRYATTSVWDNGAVDRYARGQVGWWDQDCDGILDPIDPAIVDECKYLYLPAILRNHSP